MEHKMFLTPEQEDILNGKQGEVKAQMMETLVRFGDVFGAKKMVPVTHTQGHLVTSFGLGMIKPVYRAMDKIIAAGIKADGKFTVDPRPMDFKNVKVNPVDKLMYTVIMYPMQKKYEEQLKAVGLKNDNAFTCTCYLDEVGNLPKKGDVLSWAESSAVVYANSVLGAKCNRNSGMFDLFGTLLGMVPEFGFLTDEGRKAKWIVKVQTTKVPEAQILGSAIGMKVVEDVPYVYGLDKWLGNDLTDEVKSYLKDFGAATASNGAVGLYHIDGLTPEAKESKESLILPDAKEYIIDDAELERVYKNYPIMWKNPDGKPQMCFVGCPHLTFAQLNMWADNVINGLKAQNRSKIAVRTIFCTSPDVADKFRKTAKYAELMKTGVKLTSICPLMYCDNPLCALKRIATNSNKLRTYTMSKYFKTDKLLNLIIGKEAK